MFNFRGFSCNFVTSKDIYGNTSISVYTDKEIFLYQLTEEIPYPIADNTVILKDAPFVLNFLAQMQKEGIQIGNLKKHTLNGKGIRVGTIKVQRCAAAL